MTTQEKILRQIRLLEQLEMQVRVKGEALHAEIAEMRAAYEQINRITPTAPTGDETEDAKPNQ
jgi:hypothetical protein